jgi:hypothetical protein
MSLIIKTTWYEKLNYKNRRRLFSRHKQIMIKNIAISILLFACFMGCSKKEANQKSPPPIVTKPTDTIGQVNNEQVNVLTQHNDNTRAGFNSHETVLTTSNVNASQFGKLFSLNVDDQVYAQPLVFSGLNINGGTHNVLYVATVSNTVYAFDGTTGVLYWKKNYTVSGMRPPAGADMNSNWCNPYQDFLSSIGIVGTPVIDSVSKTMYFVARSTDGANFSQYLHAISLVTGSDQPGSPVLITASVPGTGDGNASGIVSFDPRRNNQRQGLALVNGIVYIAWASHCDWNPYHGWILGYDKTTLQQKIIYNDTPNGEAGGLWQCGMGIAADAQGNLYETTGNGTVGDDQFTSSDNGTNPSTQNPNPTDLTNRGESAIKLVPTGSTLQVSTFFTPNTYYNMDENDLDYGVMGTFLIPGSNYYVTGCKDGNVYLLNKDNMGGYNVSANLVQQTIPLNVTLHCQPAFYKNASGSWVYIWSGADQLRAFSFNGSQFSTNPAVSTVAGPIGTIGANLAVSSNGSTAGTGVLWAWFANGGDASAAVIPGMLCAFDATDVTKELWNSNAAAGDVPGFFSKFCTPTIANGHVYLATFSNKIAVYGLKATSN